MDEEIRAGLIKAVAQDFSWDDFLDQAQMLKDVEELIGLTGDEAKDIILNAYVIKCLLEKSAPTEFRRFFTKLSSEYGTSSKPDRE